MPLPEWIEIVPPVSAPEAEITVPGSKSLTNRALVLAALAEGETRLRGALWSEDTEIMVGCLQELGFLVTVAPEPAEPANRTITVYGQGGRVPRGGTPEQPLDLFVGNAGTAARFLAALVCPGAGAYRLHGTPRMHERPQAGLFAALRALGYRIEAPHDRLPAVIYGAGPRPGPCTVSVVESSQFASALLLAGGVGGWTVTVIGDNAEEQPYVDMTRQLIRAFPTLGGQVDIEPDASSASYFWAADWLWGGRGRVRVARWPASGAQVDARFPRHLPLPPVLSRARDLGDSILTAMVLAPWAAHPVRFTDLGRLRLQECERVAAMREGLSRCGVRVEEVGDTLTVYPAAEPLHGAAIETYGDHRIAMCFAILGLKVPGLQIHNPACVRKTFPNFFTKLAAPPPAGLGVELREAPTGRRLSATDLEAA